jgi:RNA-binding protein
MIELTPSQRQYLKGLAHAVQPVAMIGDKGLTEAVLREIDRALASHELIKIKAASDQRDIRQAWLTQICAGLSAAPVQQIGKILVIYRPSEQPGIILPR